MQLQLKREHSNYNDINLNTSKFQSATAIRELLYKNDFLSTKEFLPDFSYNILNSQEDFSKH